MGKGGTSSHPGTTFGKIYVDTPEVYSRERLVNDRFEQDEWLRKKLNENPTQGVQASTTVSSQSSASLVISAGQSGIPGAANAGKPAAGKAKANPGRSKPDAPAAPAPRLTQDTPIEQFQDVLAYREAVRNELLENQLDDRHDIAGNTLYRLKFDVSVIPGHDTSASAIVEATVSGPDLVSSQYTGEFRPELLSKVFSKHFGDWRDGGIEYIEDVLVPIEKLDEQTYVMLQEIYEEWLENQVAEFESVIKRAIEGNRAEDAREMLRMISYGALQSYFEFANNDIDLLINLNNQELLRGLEDFYEVPSNVNRHLIQKRGFTQGDDCDYQEDLICKRYPGYEEMLKDSGFSRVWSEVTYVESYIENGDLIEISGGFPVLDSGFAKFANEVLKLSGKSVYTYAVTPKERVQRVGGEMRALQSLGLGLEGTSGAIGGQLGYSQRIAAQANAVTRKPLIVGYSGSPDDPGTAMMGWLIGPRFRLPDSADKAISFRQVPVQYSLTSIVSVPYWWKEFTLETKTYWLDEQGNRFSESGQPIDDETYHSMAGNLTTIKLPYDTQRIENLLLGRRQKPEVINNPDESLQLMACTRGSVIIRGRDLWRSTVVTLGAQTADKIKVLPNMNGIIATFDVVQPLPGLEVSAPLDLIVWTTGGEAYAGQVTVIQADTSSQAHDSCE